MMASNTEATAGSLLEQLNTLDETARIEAKEGSKIDASIMETINAFCNEPDLEGGYIILGLRSGENLFEIQYEVIGVDDPDQIQCNLATRCSNEFSIVIRPEIHVEELEDKKVIWAYIPEVEPCNKPVTFKKNNRAFRRIGPTDHKCSPDDLDKIYQLRSDKVYDKTVIQDGDMNDFNPDAIHEYRRLREAAYPGAWELAATDEQLLRSLHCLEYEADIPRPTVAGIQLFGTQASIRRCFPMSRIDYIRIAGTQWVTDPQQRFDTVEIRDSLFSAIRRSEAAILDDLPKAFHLPEGQLEREEIPRLPRQVIREAVVNAAMHRSYRQHEPISIIRYSNRLEIHNPGHSLKPEDQLGEPGSKPRNPTIAAVLHETNLAETKGSGIKAMRELMVQADLEPPTFHSSRADDEFTATFLFQHFLSEENLKWLNGLSEFKLSQENQKALVYVCEMGQIDNASYRDINRVETLIASGNLRQLRDLGLLEKKGRGSKTYYVPGEKFPKPSNLEPKPSNLESEPSNLEPQSSKLLETAELVSQLPKKTVDSIRKLGRRPAKEAVCHLILETCRGRYVTASQLAEIFDRNRDHFMTAYITPMISDDELEMKYPQTNHPQQAYKSKINEDIDDTN